MASNARLPTRAPPNANLYCSACDSQLGIYDNNWSHLTSSYAYPKEKGIDFGTQTGTNTQVVPHGTKDSTAVGCAMAQVFCKKCSALLGQCCKSAPKLEQKHLLNLIFYKTSRTYLKDAQTFARLDFNFPDDEKLPADRVPSPTISLRSSLMSRPRLPSITKASYTPLRQSLPPSMSQSQSFAQMQPPASPIPSAAPEFFRPSSSAGAPDVTQEIAEHGQAISECSHHLSLVDTRVTRSLFRLNELEEKLGAFGQHRAVASKRLDDHALELKQHALELSEHDAQSHMSKLATEKHEQRLLHLETQLDAIKANMIEMKVIFETQHFPTTSRAINTLDENNFVNGLESMLQAFKKTQTPASEVDVLKEENRVLKARLDTITQAMGAVSKDDTVIVDNERGGSLDGTTMNSSGKRKRSSTQAGNKPRKSNSRQVSAMTDTTTEQDQLPTPLSDQASFLRYQKQIHEDPPVIAQDESSRLQAENAFSHRESPDSGHTGVVNARSARQQTSAQSPVTEIQTSRPYLDRLNALHSFGPAHSSVHEQQSQPQSEPQLPLENILQATQQSNQYTKNPPSKPDNATVPENIDFSDDDEPVAAPVSSSLQTNHLTARTPSSSRPHTSTDRSRPPLLPASIMDAIRNLNNDAQRLKSAADARKDIPSKSTKPAPETSLVTKSTRKPLIPQPNTRVRSTRKSEPVTKAAPAVTSPSRPSSRGRPRKSLPLQPSTQFTSSTKQTSIGDSNTPDSSSDEGEVVESENTCTECGKGGKLLCCDLCPKVYHHRCLVPRLNPKVRVEGDWYCPACVVKQSTLDQQRASVKDQASINTSEDGALDQTREGRGAGATKEQLARRELLVSDIMRREEESLQATDSAEREAIQSEAPVVTAIKA